MGGDYFLWRNDTEGAVRLCEVPGEGGAAAIFLTAGPCHAARGWLPPQPLPDFPGASRSLAGAGEGTPAWGGAGGGSAGLCCLPSPPLGPAGLASGLGRVGGPAGAQPFPLTGVAIVAASEVERPGPCLWAPWTCACYLLA